MLEANPNYAEVHGNLGRALALKGKSDEAIAEWRNAIGLNPNYAQAYNDLGTELSRKGQGRRGAGGVAARHRGEPRFRTGVFQPG